MRGGDFVEWHCVENTIKSICQKAPLDWSERRKYA
jgi:hypothetical protein